VIELTANAASQLHLLIREKSLNTVTTGLRLAVEKGGCAGLQYAMNIGAPQADDLTIERDGARLYIEAGSVAQLDGCVIDYEDGLSGAGFRVINPRAARSCGCGTSFEPAGNART